MSLFIFGSEVIGSDEKHPLAGAWGRFLALYLGSVLALCGVLITTILVLDPYDCGRWGIAPSVGVPVMGQRLANASRGRDSNFESAIIGNSRIQLVDPGRLSQLTGRRFVSLTIPGTGPAEQLIVARWFLDHHRGSAKALVFGLDTPWCQTNGTLAPLNPFPFWLYSESALSYAAGMVSWKSFDSVTRKIKLLAGLHERARPDGYDNYEDGRVWDVAAAEQRMGKREEPGTVPGAIEPKLENPSWPGIAGLGRLVEGLPPDVVVALVFPPALIRALPPAKSVAAVKLETCKQEVRTLAAKRPGTTIIDLLADADLARRDDLFWDNIHYRGAVARRIETEIASALQGAR